MLSTHHFLGIALSGLAAFLLPLSPVLAKKPRTQKIAVTATPKKISIHAASISFSVTKKKRYGRLKWRGGLNISSSYKEFGGFSGLTLSPDGTRLLAVTDRGYWLRGELVYSNGTLAGLKNTHMGELLSRKGKTLRKKKTQDSEAIAHLSGDFTNGYALIGFERLQRIGKFRIRDGSIGAPDYYIRLPKKLRASRRNKGIEALAILRGGKYKRAVLVIPERLKTRKGNLKGWILTRKGSHRITFRRRNKFDVTDMVALPDGSLLVLERRFRKPKGFLGMLSNNIIKMRIRHIRERDIRPGRLLDGTVLLEANRRFRIDNMEGLAYHTARNGDGVITLISDDNFSALQDTLLLQFTLPKNL